MIRHDTSIFRYKHLYCTPQSQQLPLDNSIHQRLLLYCSLLLDEVVVTK